MAKIGNTIKRLREKKLVKKNMSQTDLASAVGISNGYLSAVESGDEIPTAKMQARIARGLGMSFKQFLAENADVPVINGLDDLEHPCQIMADFLTIKEQKGSLKGLKLVYLGDGNNVCNSLMLGSSAMGMNMVVACPFGYEPDAEITKRAQELGAQNGCKIEIVREPSLAVKDADVIYTDTWVSMGDEAEKEKRLADFPPFQVNEKLVAHAKPDYIFLHCLPAHRNEEVTDEIIDSPNSKVFDEAENRMWAQMAVIVKLVAPDSISQL